MEEGLQRDQGLWGIGPQNGTQRQDMICAWPDIRCMNSWAKTAQQTGSWMSSVHAPAAQPYPLPLHFSIK